MKPGLIKLEIIESVPGIHTMVRFEFPGGELMWDVSEYDRALKTGNDDKFKEINAFWATLTDEQQIRIAEIYRTIHTIFDVEPDVAAVRTQIQVLLKELYDIMPYENVLEWVRYHGRVRMPSTMRDDYGPNDPADRRRTYIRRDYMELVGFAVALRAMIPIWGEYILRNRKIAGTEYKELHALRLLYRTSIIVAEPRHRLQDYIEGVTSYELPTFSAVMRGLGTEERAEWLLALNIIRRVATGEISSPDDQSSIVTNVYNYTKSKLEQINKTFKGTVIDKSKPSRGSEEDNVSYLEMYKVKQVVSDGDLRPLDVYSENPTAMAMKIDPSIDLAKVAECLTYVKQLEQFPTFQHQVMIAQWIVAPAIPPRGIHSLSKLAVLRVLAVTQAILWHWGFFDLAVLITAKPYPMEENQVLSNLEGRNKISKTLVEELWLIYKHSKAVKTKANAPKNVPQRGINFAIESIEEYFELVKPHDWELYAPPALQEASSKIPHTRKMIVPADIRTQLAELILKFSR